MSFLFYLDKKIPTTSPADAVPAKQWHPLLLPSQNALFKRKKEMEKRFIVSRMRQTGCGKTF